MNIDTSKATILSISCVVYDTDYDVLATTIESLFIALQEAIKQQTVSNYTFYLINNHPITSDSFQQAATLAQSMLSNTEIINGHGNIGYGRANNLAIHKSQAELHLILNPDVKLDKLAINEGVTFLMQHQDVDLVAPNATNSYGEEEYLAKRMPNPLIIFLRGINSSLLNKIFKRTLDWYTYQDKLPTSKPLEIKLASGCFMLCRASTLKKIGGFSPDYFLYFEDFDLSLRLAKKILLPSMKIVHLGGKSAKKGSTHIKLFLKSFFVFLKHHGVN